MRTQNRSSSPSPCLAASRRRARSLLALAWLAAMGIGGCSRDQDGATRPAGTETATTSSSAVVGGGGGYGPVGGGGGYGPVGGGDGYEPVGGGGSTGTGGAGSGTVCPLPSAFHWTSSGPLAQPKSPVGANWTSLKDFTVVRHGGEYIVYASVFNDVPQGQPNRGYQGVTFRFNDWAQADAAPQAFVPGLVAPTLFYFTPKNVWVLASQWGFKYATSTNPADPNSWSAPSSLLSGDPTTGDPPGTGPIDQTVICDDAQCYLFFAGDNGHIYRASMAVGDFPGTFSNAVSIMADEKYKLFEAVQVYAVKGSNQYLMIVEAGDNGPRYFRAFTANSLDGGWTAMPQASSRATPFAGTNNVTFAGDRWTDDISHGDLVRLDPSEKQVIDPCNLQFLYQGRDPALNPGYDALPYRPGLLTLVP